MDAVYLERQAAPASCREKSLIAADADLYTQGFALWIEENWHIWCGFCEQANTLWARGRRHYSARTIIEWMRHNSALSEFDSEFKINNNFAPDCARLYVAMHPDRTDFFQFRVMPTSTRTKYDPVTASAKATATARASAAAAVPATPPAVASVAAEATKPAVLPEPQPVVVTPSPAPEPEAPKVDGKAMFAKMRAQLAGKQATDDPFDLNPKSAVPQQRPALPHDPFVL